MEGLPEKGEVIFVSFPYTDLSAAKSRPAVVLAQVRKDDVLICQVTSRSYADPRAIELGPDAFAQGGLPRVSYAQAGKLFTCHRRLIESRVAKLAPGPLGLVIGTIVELLQDRKQ